MLMINLLKYDFFKQAMNDYQLAARAALADQEAQRRKSTLPRQVKQIETTLHRINRLEDKLQSFYLALQATNHPETMAAVVKQYNHLNLVYATLTGAEFIPR